MSTVISEVNRSPMVAVSGSVCFLMPEPGDFQVALVSVVYRRSPVTSPGMLLPVSVAVFVYVWPAGSEVFALILKATEYGTPPAGIAVCVASPLIMRQPLTLSTFSPLGTVDMEPGTSSNGSGRQSLTCQSCSGGRPLELLNGIDTLIS